MNTHMMDGQGGPVLWAWCTKHKEPAKIWYDGSESCWWEATVQVDGNHNATDIQPIKVNTYGDNV